MLVSAKYQHESVISIHYMPSLLNLPPTLILIPPGLCFLFYLFFSICILFWTLGLFKWLSGKECACQAEDMGSFVPWVGTIAWRRKWQFTPVFLLGMEIPRTKARGRVQSMGSQSVGHRTERLHFLFTFLCHCLRQASISGERG